ncbi:putative NBD/HSP70 family sugar kinase [Nocardioides kongjuensis]|uniref:Putative NBD/HSP70 family sugar kinase n=2 Tax=Nocardioides kongjuensis TaxID=349522 RepID=A0A852RXI6_9ACTN|nr:putative NBD/HSP70 family sugar kinase [Nocardioides kongjuensis]
MLMGLDIGGTKILGVVASVEGDLLASVRVASPTGGDQVVASAAEVVEKLRAAAGGPGAGVVGVGIPGLVDVEHGTVRHAVNLGVADGYPFSERLGAVTGARVVLDNDANAAALGAAALLGERDLGYLSLGTGLAAALVLDGVLRRGSRNAAGEIGHIPVDPAGPRCECGQVGCLETVASGSAIATLWPGDGQPAAQALFDAAAAGSVEAAAVRDRFAARVADAVRLVALTVDPAVVVLGGGVAQVGERLRVAVAHALAEQAAASPFLRSLDLAGRLRLAPPDRPVAALGAALLGAS